MSANVRLRSLFARLGLVGCVVGAGLAFAATPAFATDIHVPGDYPTIQSALDAAISGDRVFVDPGTYPENLNFGGKDVTVIGTGGPAATVLDVPGGTGVLIGPGGTFQGFTVTGALESFGAGMAVSGTGTRVLGNIFDGNTETSGGYGAAIGGNSASPTIDGNIFTNNACDDQFLSGVVAFINSSSPRITNNIFAHNPCRAIDMTLPTGNSPHVADNTIVDNPVGIYVDARVNTRGQIYRNNVLVLNDIGLQVNFGSVTNDPTWQNNLVYGNGANYDGIDDLSGRFGNISRLPEFVNANRDDYRLQATSPAIDRGAPVGLKRDFAGRPRPVDGDGSGTAEYDMGAFEYQP
jgi:serine protease